MAPTPDLEHRARRFAMERKAAADAADSSSRTRRDACNAADGACEAIRGVQVMRCLLSTQAKENVRATRLAHIRCDAGHETYQEHHCGAEGSSRTQRDACNTAYGAREAIQGVQQRRVCVQRGENSYGADAGFGTSSSTLRDGAESSSRTRRDACNAADGAREAIRGVQVMRCLLSTQAKENVRATRLAHENSYGADSGF